MRARSVALLAAVFAAAALTTVFVVRQLPHEGALAPVSGTPAPPPAPASSPELDPPATAADGLAEVYVSAGGEPLAGAEVRLYLALAPPLGSDRPAWRRAGIALTGKDGIARLPARAGVYLAAARAQGLAPGRVELVRAPGEGRSAAEVDLAPPAALAGRARDPEGRPVQARVTLVALPAGVPSSTPALAPPEERTAVDAALDGGFRAEGLAPGLHALRAEAPGFHPLALPRVAVPRAGALELTLAPLGAVAGEVRAEAGGPVAGARVWASSRDHAAEAVTGADGRFALAAAAGEYRVTAALGERAGARTEPVAVTPGATSRAEVVLGGAAAVEARVATPAGTAGVAGAEAVLAPHEGGLAIGRARAAADGRLRFDGLAPGAYDLRVASPGATPALVAGLTVAPGDRLSVDVPLVALGAVEGTVRDGAGRALAGARVRALLRGDGLATYPPLEAHTDFEGRYRLDGVEAGRAELVALERGAQVGEARSVRVPPGGAARADFSLPATGELAGHVRRGGGPPPLGTAVVAVPLRAGLGAPQVARVLADASGHYRVALPAGEYRVHAAPAEAPRTDLRVAPAFVRVEAGAGGRLDLALGDAAEERGVDLVVLEPGGAPSPGAVVTLSRPDDARAAFAAAADEDGRVRLGRDLGLSGREVTIRARNGGRTGAVTRLLPADGAVAIRLAPGASVAGRLQARGRGVRGFTLEVASLPAADRWRTLDVHRFAGDRFELGDLPPEPVRLMVRTDDGRSAQAEVTLSAGEVRTVELALPGTPPAR